MTISKQVGGTELTIIPQGRLDTATSPMLETELKSSLDGIESLIFDFSELEYISSAGLRVLLSALKIMSAKGRMCVKNVNADIMEILELTGFCDLLTIE